MNENTPNTLTELVDFYVSNNATIRSRGTESLLRLTCRHFSKSLGREALVSDLTDRAIVAYLRWREQQHGRVLRDGTSKPIAKATLERETAKLITLGKFAAMHGLTKALSVKVPRSCPTVPEAFLKHEVRALMKAAHEAQGEVGGVPNGIFFPAILALCLETGERAGAIRALNRSDIDLRSRYVTYRHRKAGGEPIVRQFSRATGRALKRLLAVHPHETPFGHVHLTTMYFHLKRILTSAGLPNDRRSMLHRLRRTHASYLRVGGGDPTTSLGHSSDAVTKRHYLDVRITRGKEAIDYIFNPFGWRDRLRGLFAR